MFNNAIKENNDWTYSINFYEMFRSNWLDYCTIQTWDVNYYNKNWDWSCWPTIESDWNCKTDNYLIYQDWDWKNHYFKLDWDDNYTKTYVLDKVDDKDISCDN